MQQELFDNFETDLQKALKDEKHNLEKSMRALIDSFTDYKNETMEVYQNNEELIAYAGDLEKSNADYLSFIKDLYLILNAEKEKSLQIKGMEDILKAMTNLVVSPSAIKAGIMHKARGIK